MTTNHPSPISGTVAMPMILVDPATGNPYVAGTGGAGTPGGGPTVATTVTEGSTALTAATAADVVAATGTARGMAFKNRGPNDTTYRIDATATGASTERTLLAGEEKTLPYMTDKRVSFFSASGTTIEWETWS